MKISTLVSVALASAAQFVNALPAAQPEAAPIPEPAAFAHDGPVIRGAGHLHEQWLRKRNVDRKQVTGVRTGYSGAYRVYRQEISKFMNDQNGRVGDLFLLALTKMYTRNKGDWNSYWELAGVHGRPYHYWSDADNNPSDPANLKIWYCTHGSTLFPTWHRPYLAYFEEVVWANAKLVIDIDVKNAAQKKEWEKALNVLRLPYWDWALNNANGLPSVFLQETWTYRFHPSGNANVRAANPLFSAKLKSGTYNDPSLFPEAPWNRHSTTKRAPYDINNPNTGTNFAALNGAFSGSNGANLKDRVYALLMNNNRWSTFSNRAGANGIDSLEAIHDTVHGNIGQGGHMSNVLYSAFDPIFFLHHCNVDRLFAIWQAIHPTTYVSAQVNGGATYGVPPNTLETRTSNLRPWRGLSGGLWTSDGVRDTSLFGYGYYETPKWKYSKATESQYASATRALVERMYGNSITSSTNAKRDLNNATEAGIDASFVKPNTYYEWRIDCIADKSAVNGTFIIHFFLGKPSKNPKEWLLQPELVGDYVVFTHSMQAAPGIDPSEIDNSVSGSVPLTRSMIAAFKDTDLNSLKPEDAIPFLEKNLRWRVSRDDGTPIRVRDVKGLAVSVSISLVSLPDPSTGRLWKEFGDWTKLTDITRRIGRDGGPDKVGIIPSPSAMSVSSTIEPATSTEAPASTTEAPESTTTSSAEATSTSETSTSEAPAPTEK
ncbi:Tyrosinase [Dactylella cylindrospora]|nr:Tyrosinase [Dactylella cylindrospora]